MKTAKLLIVFVLILFSSVLQATTYYVDATGGNDSNNGKTEATAWKTISKVIKSAKDFKPGDNILFKRGERWDKRFKVDNHPSGTSENPITYGAYGTGEKPIINVFVEQSNINWVLKSENQWQADIECGTRFFKNGVEMIRSVKAKDLGSNSFGTEYYYKYLGGPDGGPSILRVYSTGNPSSDIFSWSSEIEAFMIKGANYIKLENLDIQGSSGQGALRMRVNNHWVITNCNIGWNATYGITMRFCSDILIDNCTFDANHMVNQSESPGNFRGADDTGCDDGIYVSRGCHDITVSNCLFKNWGHASFDAYSSKPDQPVTNVKFHHNELTTPNLIYGGRLLYQGYSEDGEYYNNYIHDIGCQNQMTGSRNHFHHNIIDGVKNSDLKDDSGAGIMIQNNNDQTRDNIYENNIIANTGQEGIMIYSINFDRNNGDEHGNLFEGNIIRNNIIYNCGNSTNQEPSSRIGVGIQFHEDKDGQKIYNNIVENNLIFNEKSPNGTNSTPCMFQFNNERCSPEDFNTKHADIRNNIGGDPMFVDIENGDYHLRKGSPAIDAGTLPLAKKDFDGKVIPNGLSTDIGIFEH